MPDIIHRRIQKNEFRHVLLNELEIGITAQVRDIVHRPGDEIVDANDFVTAREQQVSKMGAEETGGAGNDAGSGSRTQMVPGFDHLAGARLRRLTQLTQITQSTPIWLPLPSAQWARCAREF